MGVLIEREGMLVGEMWGAVRPEDRHQGIGTTLWRANRDRLAAAAAADPRPGPRELRSYALDIEAADLALIADQGYVPIRYGFEMRRFLTGSLPEHPLPDGLELRPVRPEDHRAIWEADAEAFRDHWGHREQTEGDFVARYAAPETDTALWSVAWDGDEVAGSVMTAIFTEENEALGIKRGWLEHVSVRRPWRGRGLAKALCADSFRVLRDHGHGGGVARRRRDEPDRRAPAVRAPRVHGRPPLAGVRAADGRPGARGLDLGRTTRSTEAG